MSVGSVEVFEHRIAQATAILERVVLDMKSASGSALAPIATSDSSDGTNDEIEGGSPEYQLATGLRVDADQRGFVWMAIAIATEPRCAILAALAFGPDAKLGLSITNYVLACPMSVPRRRRLLELLQPTHPLRKHGLLLSAFDGPVLPATIATPWIAHPRLVTFLQQRSLEPVVEAPITDPTLAGFACYVRLPDENARIFSAAQQAALATLRAQLAPDHEAVVIVEGPAKSGRTTALAAASAAADELAQRNERVVIEVNCEFLPASRCREVLQALQREVALSGALPLLANLDVLWAHIAKQPSGDDAQLLLRAMFVDFPGALLITCHSTEFTLASEQRMQARVRWPVADAVTRKQLWQLALCAGGSLGASTKNTLDTADLDLLAHRYALGAGAIRDAIPRDSSAAITFHDVVAGVQNNIAERLGELATRVHVVQRWDELVLPPETRDDIEALIGRVQNSHFVLDDWGFRQKLARGAGVAALFSGPPGTGKTMVAGLIAQRLQLELYQVDLSRIVSKWVGETEKQLAKLFDAAEAGHALLLFDEADSLFAKRSSDVKSATDRYANLEVNYLLQRVESFGGFVVLTTNLDASIDPALRRRLASHIVFQQPEGRQQESLWRGMLATGAPLQPGINFTQLAEDFRDMTGANIRNAVLRAAFAAATSREPISEDQLRSAARGEYRAMGRVLGRGARTSEA